MAEWVDEIDFDEAAVPEPEMLRFGGAQVNLCIITSIYALLRQLLNFKCQMSNVTNPRKGEKSSLYFIIAV